MKAFAEDSVNLTEKLEFVLEMVGKEENAGYQHFLLFQQCFQKAPYTGSLKGLIMW